jgi:HEAT repeat protein
MLSQDWMKRREGWLLPVLIAVSLLAALWASGCSSDDDSTAISPAQIRAAINGFDGANISSLDLDTIVAACKAALPVLEELLAQGDRAARWAALVALAAIGHQCNAAEAVLPDLKSALSDPDISMRVTAAELVTSFGDKAGIPVLIDAVDSDVENLRPAEPPTPVSTQAIRVLGHYTGQAFTQEADWQAWWDANQDSLEWDPDNERFS